MRTFKLIGDALRAESFPMDRQGIDYCIGDIEILSETGGSIPIRDVTDLLEGKEFHSPREVLDALHAALKREPSQAA